MSVAKGRHGLVADSTVPVVAVVADSLSAAESLKALIVGDGFRIFSDELPTGARDVAPDRPDLVVMDIGEASSARETELRLQQCRERWQVPIFCLLPLAEHLHPELIAQLGADDYLLKPIRLLEFGSRLRVLLQRSRASKGVPLVERRRARGRRQEDRQVDRPPAPVPSPCVIDDTSKTIVLEGRTLDLSPREYELFRLLHIHVGRILSAQEIIEHIWQDAKRATASDVHQYMHLLRRKVELDPETPRWIVTVRGFGYKLVIPAEA